MYYTIFNYNFKQNFLSLDMSSLFRFYIYIDIFLYIKRLSMYMYIA